MPAPLAILAKPDDHRGILTMAEAVDAMLDAFRNWANDPLVAELRRRTHTPKNVRLPYIRARHRLMARRAS